MKKRFPKHESEPSSGTIVREPLTEVPPVTMSDLRVETEDRARLMEQVEAMMSQVSPTAADVIIIGGGPGGYVAAIRAAQLGGRVILVEKDELGGVCLNRGCIPTKVMLSSADVYDTIARRSGEFGVNVGDVSLDYAKVLDRRDKVVKQLVSGVHFLMKKHNIQVLRGTARLASRTAVEVTLPDGKKETIAGRNIIIATGSEPVALPIPGLEGENVWDSDGALKATEVPKTLLIIGGGYIGVEWGYMFQKFGSQVTIVELMPEILLQTDSEVAAELRKILEKHGIRILTGAQVTKVAHKKGQETATIRASGDSERQITADKILVAVGRRPVSADLGLEELGIAADRGKILVNERMHTNVANTYAIGDVVGGMLLAHKASEEGVVAAENCMGQSSTMAYDSVPGAIYTTPEVATVGMTEEAAKKQGMDYKVGKFYFRANGKALGLGEREGFVKFITGARYGEILGCHMIGPHVTDLIHEVVVGMDAEATIEVIGRAVHAHPTLSEVVKEAALDTLGESLHKG
ncbi:MAG TPA: dihydrolipoyl dehydrogenase [Armatimonadota bacterium]|nr:dihydrolipoyl dehydrogenase [Armatimonadota bacterium]